MLHQEAALMAVGQPAELVQQGVGNLQRHNPEDLGAGDGQRCRPLGQEPVVQQTARLLTEEPGQEQRIAPEAERGDQLGQPRVLRERLGRLGGGVMGGLLGSLLD
jgi:hypothetical protein